MATGPEKPTASSCDLGNAAEVLHRANPAPSHECPRPGFKPLPLTGPRPPQAPPLQHRPAQTTPFPWNPVRAGPRSPDPAHGLHTFVRRAPLRLVLLVLLPHGCGRSGSAEKRLPVARPAPVGSGPFAPTEHFRVRGRCSARGRFEARRDAAGRSGAGGGSGSDQAQPRCTVPRLRRLLRGASLGPRSLGSRRRCHGRGGGRPEASASLCCRVARGSRGGPAAPQQVSYAGADHSGRVLAGPHHACLRTALPYPTSQDPVPRRRTPSTRPHFT